MLRIKFKQVFSKGVIMNYDEKLQLAVERARNWMAEGVTFYTATEYASEDFDVSLCDVQKILDV